MSMSNNMSVFTTSIKNLPDLAKNYLYQIIFEYESGSVLSNVIGTDDFMLRAKTASIQQNLLKSSRSTCLFRSASSSMHSAGRPL